MSMIDRSVYELCSLNPTYNVDSPAVKLVMSYNYCIPSPSNRLPRANHKLKCQLRLEEKSVPVREKRSNKPGPNSQGSKDQKKTLGQVITNTKETIKNKLKSTENADERIMKDKYTMSGPERGKM